jgi:hypothetical protein
MRNTDARNAVVTQADGLCQAGPDINHVRHDGVPVEVFGGFDGSVEGFGVIVRDLLAGVAGIFGGELGYEWPNGHRIRLLVAQGGDVTIEALLVELLGLHGEPTRANPNRRSNATGKIGRPRP